VEMVINNLRRNGETAKAIIRDVIPNVPDAATWPCHSALANAIMTARGLWPKPRIKALRPLLGKYL